MVGEQRYTIISADCHAGGSMEQYASYLDSQWRDEFDQWQAKYVTPWRDLTGDSKVRNWDSFRRFDEQQRDGIVAEIVFPNTVPPFFPTNSVVAPTPTAKNYERRLAGIRAHNRWQVEWLQEAPKRRKGLIQIFLNDIDAAVADIREFHERGINGGVLLPGVAPDSGLPPLFARDYDPIWAVCEELNLTIAHHGGGTGIPNYGNHPATMIVFAMESPWWADRAVWHLIWGGVFQRFPGLRFVLTEVGIKFVPEMLRSMDYFHSEMVKGRLGEIAFEPDQILKETPSTYFNRNCFIGSAYPSPSDAAIIREVGIERVMWGSDYPHHESTYPYTRESLRLVFSDWGPHELQTLLAGTASRVYGFDLDALRPLADQFGPTHADIARRLDAIPAKATSPAFSRP